MKWAWRAWDRFFFARFDPYSLGLLRISLGIFWLVMLLFMGSNWDRYFAADGLPSAVDPLLAASQDTMSVFAWTDGWVSVWFWWWFGIVTACLWIIGFGTRLMTIAAWLLISSMIHRDIMMETGEDVVMHAAFWFAIFMPLGHEVSVDAWLRRRRFRNRNTPDPRPMPMIWSTRLFQLMVVSIYAFSLPRKIFGDVAWLNGDAFFFAIINGHWSRWPLKSLFFHHWLSAVMTYATLVVEGLFPILVWFRRTRLPAVIVMAIFHLCIALMLDNVAFFSLSMVATYWVFIPGAQSRRLMRAMTNRRIAR